MKPNQDKLIERIGTLLTGWDLDRKHAEELLRIVLPKTLAVRAKIIICPACGKEMTNAIDSITKKISKYLWKCDCEESKNMRLSRG